MFSKFISTLGTHVHFSGFRPCCWIKSVDPSFFAICPEAVVTLFSALIAGLFFVTDEFTVCAPIAFVFCGLRVSYRNRPLWITVLTSLFATGTPCRKRWGPETQSALSEASLASLCHRQTSIHHRLLPLWKATLVPLDTF